MIIFQRNFLGKTCFKEWAKFLKFHIPITGFATTNRVTFGSSPALYAHSTDKLFESDQDLKNANCNANNNPDIASQLINGEIGKEFKVLFDVHCYYKWIKMILFNYRWLWGVVGKTLFRQTWMIPVVYQVFEQILLIWLTSGKWRTIKIDHSSQNRWKLIWLSIFVWLIEGPSQSISRFKHLVLR